MILAIILSILIFLAFSATYAGALFFISKVSFLGMTIPTYWDAFQFSVALSIFSLVFGSLIGILYVASRKQTLVPPDPNPIILFLISFIGAFGSWFIMDLLFTSISIPFWVLFVFSLLMSVSNFNKLRKSIVEKEEDHPSEVNKN
ncbi:hypothetical protein [Bacillus cereus]|uniref:hypothetical protein n=1 Tax=Bacillus cereus TaxID=1396 RepID=UPI000B4ABBC2|nr:hypothetical protein [Bacillus cereus]